MLLRELGTEIYDKEDFETTWHIQINVCVIRYEVHFWLVAAHNGRRNPRPESNPLPKDNIFTLL